MVALGEQHRRAFVVARPPGIAVAPVREVRSQQRIAAIVRQFPLERFETDSLQDDIAIWVAKYFLLDPIASIKTRVRQLIDGDARFYRRIGE